MTHYTWQCSVTDKYFLSEPVKSSAQTKGSPPEERAHHHHLPGSFEKRFCQKYVVKPVVEGVVKQKVTAKGHTTLQVQHFTSMAAELPHYTFSSQVRLNRAACPTLCRHTHGVLKNELFQNRKTVKLEKNDSATQIQSPVSHCSLESCKDCLGNSAACSRSMADIWNPACAPARQTWKKAGIEIQTPGYHCSSQLQLFTVKKEVSLL